MKEYISKYRNHIILMGLFLFLIHGRMLNSIIIGIDTEDIIHLQEQFYGGWLYTGRQGLVFLKWLMNSMQFHPLMAGLLTLVLFCLAVSGFLMLWDGCLQIKEKNIWAWVAGGLLWTAHPVMTERLYFTLMSVEIYIGIFLTAVVLALVSSLGGIRGQRGRHGWETAKFTAAVLLLILLFSTYQAFVPFYIFGVTAVLFFKSLLCMQNGQKVGAKKLLKPLVPYVAVFFTAFAVNTVVTRLFFDKSDYLDGQILWGKYPVTDNLRAIYHHMRAVLTGHEDIHYSFAYGLLCIVAVLGVFLLVFRSRQGTWGGKAVILFYFAAMLSTPFWMTVVCGGFPVVRSQLVLPAMTGLLGYLDIWLVAEYRKRTEDNRTERSLIKQIVLPGLVGIICFLGVWQEVDVTLTFHYTEEMCYEQDASLGREISYDIESVMGGENLPVVFVGRRPFSGNNATLCGEIIGRSFFDHDVDVEPVYYWSSRRILGFLHTLGADYRLVDKSQMDKARERGQNMAVWPAQGSVCKYDDMVVVKLSEMDE